MDHKLLDTVVLTRELPEHGLRHGDLGTVVELYPPDGVEVEFVSATGRPRAIVSLSTRDVRAITDTDVFTVRPLDKATDLPETMADMSAVHPWYACAFGSAPASSRS